MPAIPPAEGQTSAWNPSGSAGQSTGTQQAYVADETLSATSSDTSSVWGDDVFDEGDVAGLPADQVTDQIYWQYAQAKKRWRRHTQKPVRRVRRFTKRKGGKGQGGRNSIAYITGTPEVEAFFQGRSSKGAGRKGGTLSTG